MESESAFRNRLAASRTHDHKGVPICTVSRQVATMLEECRLPRWSMGVFYRFISRPFLAVQDSELAHGRALKWLERLSKNQLTSAVLRGLYKPKINLEVEEFGLKFRNPFGIAAGMDKKGEALIGWQTIGCGFIEIGGITMHKQRGNPKPRMYRDNSTRSLVNRMGFNNVGSKEMAELLKTHFDQHGKPTVPLFANVGKSKITPLSDSDIDYCTTIESLSPYVDAFVINVSSPNTPNLRELQESSALDHLLSAIQETNKECSNRPILIKIAPDLSFDQIDAIVETAMKNDCSGIILCNTTLKRTQKSVSKNPQIHDETGGLSGSPLKDRSTEIIAHVSKITNNRWPIIGVGGIMNSEDAWEKITAGACLVQSYSGFVFEGPAIVSEIVNGLNKKLVQNGFKSLREAVGTNQE